MGNLNKLLLVSVVIIFASCSSDKARLETEAGSVFSELESSQTKIFFNNIINENKDTNVYKYGYLYNGGGVGIGDINNDGLSDVILTSTLGQSKLYLNKGDFKFEDISDQSGLSSYSGIKAGVTMVDVNNDSWLDIYICRQSLSGKKEELKNLLLINNKDNTFKESAEEYGIADIGYSTQSAFFDFDNDGDLDLYIMNHPGEFEQPLNLMIQKIENPTHEKSDHFYRNDNGKYIDISKEAGITNYGYGLGIAVGDLNKDGFLDVFVSNDFAPHDYYYINNGDGTFTESIQEKFKHCSYFSMGCDLADLNHDTYLDLFVVEMLSEDNKRQKTNMAPMDLDRFAYMVNNGLFYQYMRNALHLNNTNGTFSDIAYYSGIDKTDWSWGTLFSDYNNDGYDDLVVVNGYLKDTQDKDFGKKSNQLAETHNNRLTFDQISSLLKSTPIQNYVFEGKGEMKFENRSKSWGFDHKGFSNGVAYGDLDNDGDLDLIVNNINDIASVYKNNTNTKNFIGFTLEGPSQNKSALHSEITVKTNFHTRFKDFQVSRGFQSSVDHKIHFSFLPDERIEQILIKWPNGITHEITKYEVGVYNNLIFDESLPSIAPPQNTISPILSPTSVAFEKHVEDYYNDYDVEILLPHQLSQLGPAIAIGDINKDGLDDLYIGGARSYFGNVYMQNPNGTYSKKQNPSIEADRKYEDVAAVFFDANNDGNLDLYVCSGSNEYPEQSDFYQDRIYLGDGQFGFDKAETLIPKITSSTGSISKCDFDKDGDIDLFVGGRVVPGKYPRAPRSYLLVNDNNTFVDKTSQINAELENIGMVTSSVWSDYNNDGWQDLIIVGEWMDILFYKNINGKLERDNVVDQKNVGWWNNIVEADLDNDGDMDYIVGNLGENYKYKASDDRPFEIYSYDFDENGQLDIALGYYSDDELYPVRGLQCSSEQIPDIKKKFKTYEDFGASNLFEIYGDKLNKALNIKANEFRSIILRNNDGRFTKEILPYQAQFAPIKGISTMDLNDDGFLDIIVAGNWYVAEIETPRADAGTGLILMSVNNGKNFDATPLQKSGLYVQKDVRGINIVNSKNKASLLVTSNNNTHDLFEIKTN